MDLLNRETFEERAYKKPEEVKTRDCTSNRIRTTALSP